MVGWEEKAAEQGWNLCCSYFVTRTASHRGGVLFDAKFCPKFTLRRTGTVQEIMNPKSVEVLLYHNTFIFEKARKFQLGITWLAKREIKNTIWFHVVFKLSLES